MLSEPPPKPELLWKNAKFGEDDFVNRVYLHYKMHSRSRDNWIQTNALGLLAPFCDNVTLYDYKGDVKPNIFGMCIGPSRFGEKSIPLGITEDILKIASESVWNKTEDQAKEEQLAIDADEAESGKKRNRYQRTLIVPLDASSKEAMHDHLSQSPSGTIIKDEMTELFKDVKNRQNLSSTFEFLSRGYDNKLGVRVTKQWGYIYANNLNLSMLTATTTTIYDIMEPQFFVQGTGNRFLISLFDITESEPIEVRRDYYDIAVEQEYGEESALQKGNQELARDLVFFRSKLHEKGHIRVHLSDSAKYKLIDYIQNLLNEAKAMYLKDKKDPIYSYRGGLELQVNKLALLFCMSTHFADVLKNPGRAQEPSIVGNASDIVRAIDACDEYWRNYKQMYEEWGENTAKQQIPLYSLEPVIAAVKKYIAKHRDNDGWVNRNKLIKALSIDRRQFLQVEDMYLETHERRPPTGRASVWVRLRED